MEEGRPCPVCGSPNHPLLAKKSSTAPSADQLKKAKRSANEAQKDAEEKSGKCASSKTKFEEQEKAIKAQIKELGLTAEIETADHAVITAINENNATVSSLKAALKEEDKRIKRKEKLDKELPKKNETLMDSEKVLYDLNTEITTLITEINTQNEHLEKSKNELVFDNKESAEKRINELTETIKDLEETAGSVDSSDKKLGELKAAIAELEKQVSGNLNLDPDAEQKKKDILNNKQKDIESQLITISTRLKTNRNAEKNIKTKAGDLDSLEKQLTWMKALSDTANGTLNGKEKIMLETYIQMTFFDRIIAKANTRFMIMSGGQYELKRRKASENIRSQSGLDLDVIDHYNGTERSVNSLSGGESFKASLSLALGLSDEIQSSVGGIKLDTMFVDEGFGSLDEESIDQAMKALADLAGENRLVGIISHVGELKNRIDRQIVVTKDPCGKSKATIMI